jgi:hypothetical protein
MKSGTSESGTINLDRLTVYEKCIPLCSLRNLILILTVSVRPTYQAEQLYIVSNIRLQLPPATIGKILRKEPSSKVVDTCCDIEIYCK